MTQKMLSRMLSLAARAHEGQFDRGGVPYFMHVMQVMRNLKTDDEELKCIALGHDLLEDTNVTEEEILTNTNYRVLMGIKALTKIEGESYEDYKDKVKSNWDAVLVKMADLTHNSDIRRLKGITQKDLNRVVEYQRFYKELEALL